VLAVRAWVRGRPWPWWLQISVLSCRKSFGDSAKMRASPPRGSRSPKRQRFIPPYPIWRGDGPFSVCRPVTAVGQLRPGRTSCKVQPRPQFDTPIVHYLRRAYVQLSGKNRLPEALPKKSATYRSFRFFQLAALVPSVGTLCQQSS
jgi:hypothetical protein